MMTVLSSWWQNQNIWDFMLVTFRLQKFVRNIFCRSLRSLNCHQLILFPTSVTNIYHSPSMFFIYRNFREISKLDICEFTLVIIFLVFCQKWGLKILKLLEIQPKNIFLIWFYSNRYIFRKQLAEWFKSGLSFYRRI